MEEDGPKAARHSARYPEMYLKIIYPAASFINVLGTYYCQHQ